MEEGLNVTVSYRVDMRNVDLGPLSLRVFRLPNAMYCLCLADVLAVESNDSAIRTARSKISRSPTLPTSIQIEGIERVFTPISLDAAIVYWQTRAMEENREAQRVIKALTQRSLRELADKAFGFI